MQALQELCRSYAGVPRALPGLGLLWGHQRVPAGHSSLPEPPSWCQTQTPPAPAEVRVSRLALQHGAADGASAGNTGSHGLICRRHSCLAVPARSWCPPPAPPGTAPRPRPLPGNVLPCPNSSTGGFSPVPSVSNPTLPPPAQGCCLPSGTSPLQFSLFSALPRKLGNFLFCRAS